MHLRGKSYMKNAHDDAGNPSAAIGSVRDRAQANNYLRHIIPTGTKL